MKIYGKRQLVDDPGRLEEVVLQVGPAEARLLAAFLTECAQEMESNDAWEHRHFSDWQRGADAEGTCELIVFKP